jgi:hypothetical protein
MAGTSVDEVMCSGESTMDSMENLYWRCWRRRACLVGSA